MHDLVLSKFGFADYHSLVQYHQGYSEYVDNEEVLTLVGQSQVGNFMSIKPIVYVDYVIWMYQNWKFVPEYSFPSTHQVGLDVSMAMLLEFKPSFYAVGDMISQILNETTSFQCLSMLGKGICDQYNPSWVLNVMCGELLPWKWNKLFQVHMTIHYMRLRRAGNRRHHTAALKMRAIFCWTTDLFCHKKMVMYSCIGNIS